ncbi:GP88 family protein [Rhizobium ruizarguesonis]|uniref:Gene product 88 domain-containing protein n=1 Tax=Rhizobium phage vB_RleA_TRX32-1 TaxID=2777321 RepID=A0A7T7GRS0_9CAUD|nr:hypothetical protein [Rhizobium ruizarguesonis]QQM14043.1 hypothetical protein [Rhizobium phage vB_RleA_TRX32-1]TBE66419.1 hypothetical protein ELH00_10700 [Rhizobium ruizarguesonis]
MFKGTLIRSGNNAKTIKGDGEYETAIMYLAPFTMAGSNVCPMAEQAGCVKGCLNTAGRGAYNNVQQARIAKTKRYLASRTAFMADLVTDLERFVAYCKRKGVKPAVRLNGTSDIQWEVAHYASRGDARGSVFELFPEVQFYDYTKVYKRAYRQLPANYALTLSYSAANPAYAEVVTKAAHETGANLAIVYRTKELRDYFVGKLVQYGDACRDVIDGDETDMRFLDPKGVIVGLYAKGKAKGDQSGFVVG